METLAQRLQKLIEKRGITPYKLAIESGVSQSSISRILNTNAKPNIKNTKALCNYLGISESYLLTGEGTAATYTPQDLSELKKKFEHITVEELARYMLTCEDDLLQNDIFKLYIEKKSATKALSMLTADFLKNIK